MLREMKGTGAITKDECGREDSQSTRGNGGGI